jgi:hypothetical protein
MPLHFTLANPPHYDVIDCVFTAINPVTYMYHVTCDNCGCLHVVCSKFSESEYSITQWCVIIDTCSTTISIGPQYTYNIHKWTIYSCSTTDIAEQILTICYNF